MPRWVYRKGIRDTGPIMVLLGISGLATFIQSVLEPRQPPAFRRQLNCLTKEKYMECAFAFQR